MMDQLNSTFQSLQVNETQVTQETFYTKALSFVEKFFKRGGLLTLPEMWSQSLTPYKEWATEDENKVLSLKLVARATKEVVKDLPPLTEEQLNEEGHKYLYEVVNKAAKAVLQDEYFDDLGEVNYNSMVLRYSLQLSLPYMSGSLLQVCVKAVDDVVPIEDQNPNNNNSPKQEEVD